MSHESVMDNAQMKSQKLKACISKQRLWGNIVWNSPYVLPINVIWMV